MNHSPDFIDDSALKYLFSAALLRQAYFINATSLQRSRALSGFPVKPGLNLSLF